MRDEWELTVSGCGWTTTDCGQSWDTSEAHTDLDNGHPLLPTLLDECLFVYLLPIKVLQTATRHAVSERRHVPAEGGTALLTLLPPTTPGPPSSPRTGCP